MESKTDSKTEQLSELLDGWTPPKIDRSVLSRHEFEIRAPYSSYTAGQQYTIRFGSSPGSFIDFESLYLIVSTTIGGSGLTTYSNKILFESLMKNFLNMTLRYSGVVVQKWDRNAMTVQMLIDGSLGSGEGYYLHDDAPLGYAFSTPVWSGTSSRAIDSAQLFAATEKGSTTAAYDTRAIPLSYLFPVLREMTGAAIDANGIWEVEFTLDGTYTAGDHLVIGTTSAITSITTTALILKGSEYVANPEISNAIKSLRAQGAKPQIMYQKYVFATLEPTGGIVNSIASARGVVVFQNTTKAVTTDVGTFAWPAATTYVSKNIVYGGTTWDDGSNLVGTGRYGGKMIADSKRVFGTSIRDGCLISVYPCMAQVLTNAMDFNGHKFASLDTTPHDVSISLTVQGTAFTALKCVVVCDSMITFDTERTCVITMNAGR